MIELTPRNELHLRAALTSVQQYLPYAPPEATPSVWMRVCGILERAFGPFPPREDWQRKVAREFKGER